MCCPSKFGNYIVDIYPAELEIKDTTDADHRASYLDKIKYMYKCMHYKDICSSSS